MTNAKTKPGGARGAACHPPGRTGVIALVVCGPEAGRFTEPYQKLVTQVSRQVLAAAGWLTILIPLDNDDDALPLVRFLDDGHVDGALVFTPSWSDELPAVVRPLKIPVVFGSRSGGPRHSEVEAMVEQLLHLARLGAAVARFS